MSSPNGLVFCGYQLCPHTTYPWREYSKNSIPYAVEFGNTEGVRAKVWYRLQGNDDVARSTFHRILLRAKG